MESQPLLVHTHIVRKSKNKLYCCYALIAAVLISVFAVYVSFPAASSEPLELVATFDKALPTELESFSNMEIYYKGNGLYVESEVSFDNVPETMINYVVKSNDPNCMEHLVFAQDIFNGKLDISLASDYSGFHYPSVSVYLTIKIPKFIKLLEFQGEGGLIWNGKGHASWLNYFSSKSNFGSTKINNLNGRELLLTSNSGSITVNDTDCKTNVALRSNFGSITIENLKAQHLDAQANSGSIKLHKVIVKEASELETLFGSIKGTQLNSGSLNVKTNSGAIEFERANIQDGSKFKSSFGSIRLDDLKSESLVAGASSGSVHALNIELAEFLEIKSSFGSIEVDIKYYDSKTASAILEATSGKIYGKILDYKSLEAHSSYGSIKLTASPKKAEASTSSLTADSGTINTTFEGYQGQFDSTTSSGSLNINGDVEFIVDRSHKKSGIVGEGTKGTVVTHSTFGSTTLYFK
ncbi:hypothetical protein HDV06_001908 [Boothiomyces sp. JEL0866]|nr:hypothetical protein HDV06_001908 [Boothiomyces sp. JEL0866]